MKFSAPFLSALLYASTTFAAETPPSLFFTPQEVQQIETPGQAAEIPSPDIHLGAILYYGNDNWTIWLDGERWTKDTRRPDLQIIEVRPDLIRMVLQRTNLSALPIVLRPYQTYEAATGKVVEGMR